MAKQHTHKYFKFDELWHCGLPDCTHFMPKNVAGQVEGKYTLCWECGAQFILDRGAMERDKPICARCTLGDVDVDILDDILNTRLK